MVSGNGYFILNGFPNRDRGSDGDPMGIPDNIPDGDRAGFGDRFSYRFRGRGHHSPARTRPVAIPSDYKAATEGILANVPVN